MKVYTPCHSEVYNILNNVLNTEKFSDLNSYKIRYSVIFVKDLDPKSGEVFSVFQGLPYRVKINNAKDRILKNKDVDIIIDKSYWDSCSDEELEVLMISALSQLQIVVKKDFPVFNEDGVVKLKLKKPDMFFAGFSSIAEEYGSVSPERKLWKDFIYNFTDCLR